MIGELVALRSMRFIVHVPYLVLQVLFFPALLIYSIFQVSYTHLLIYSFTQSFKEKEVIVSFLNQKGGVGKTTLTINIAHCFALKGKSVAIIDTDKQASARDWHEQNDGQILDVYGLDRSTLDIDFKTLNLKRDWIFIDGVPQVSMMAAKSLSISDVVLIPVQPSPYDIWSSNEIASLAKRYHMAGQGKPKVAFIINRKIVNSNIGKEVYEALKQYDLPVFKSYTSQRVIYPEVVQYGYTVFKEPNSEAVNEIENICQELMEFSNEK